MDWPERRVKITKIQHLCQSWTGSSPAPAELVWFQLSFVHQWHCMECTSYWPKYIHIVNMMYISDAFIQISFNIIHREYTNMSSLIQRVPHYLTDEKPLLKTLLDYSSMHIARAMCADFKCKIVLRDNTNIQKDGKGLALVKCRISDNTTFVPEPDENQSDASSIGLVQARFRP